MGVCEDVFTHCNSYCNTCTGERSTQHCWKQFCPRPEATPWSKISKLWLRPAVWHPFVDTWTNFNGKSGGKGTGKSIQSCNTENTHAATALAFFHSSCYRLLGLTHPLCVSEYCVQSLTALIAKCTLGTDVRVGT